MSAKPNPNDVHSVTPYLIVKDAKAALDFYHKAFHAIEMMRLEDPSGVIMHSEFKIGNTTIMMANEYPDMGYVGPQTLGGTPVSLYINVENAESVELLFHQAVGAGAENIQPVQDHFYGVRSGTIRDPFGHVWSIGAETEKLTADEIMNRMNGTSS